jgi:predicted acylesterase/phospholipase RssA
VTRDIGVALSGGGSRAAAFHLGCLRALHDRGLLSRVRIVSGVSGGALLAALYAYGPANFEEFDAAATTLLRRGLQRAIALRFLTSRRSVQSLLSLVSLPLSGYMSEAERAVGDTDQQTTNEASHHHGPARLRRVNRTTAFVDVLEQQLFGSRMLSQVSHPGLDVVLTACDLGTGGAVRFGSKVSACTRVGTLLDEVRVATAVAASAAYPALLPALEERFRFRHRAGQEFDQVLLLTDGGVYDNLGLSVLDVTRDELYTPHVYPVEYIIACDAGAGQSRPAAPHIWPARMKRVVEIMHGRAQHGERARLYAAGSSAKLSGFVYAYLGMRDDRLPVPPVDLVPRGAVASYPTDFRAMSQDDLDALSTRGEQLVRALLPQYCPSLY